MYVNWTDPALNDLDSIFSFIAKEAPGYAQNFVLQIMQAVDRLQDFPKSGRSVPEAAREDIREVIFQGYRIIYWIIDEQRTDILATMHGSRDLSNTANQPWEIH